MRAIFKHIKLTAVQDLGLYLSPFIGAYKAIKIELARPVHSDIKDIVRGDVRLYFAPFAGAIDEIKKELQRLKLSNKNTSKSGS